MLLALQSGDELKKRGSGIECNSLSNYYGFKMYATYWNPLKIL